MGKCEILGMALTSEVNAEDPLLQSVVLSTLKTYVADFKVAANTPLLYRAIVHVYDLAPVLV